MRPFPAIACALLLTTSCTHALSQTKTQVIAGDADTAVDGYAALLKPQLPLKQWQPRLSAPKLRCPQGAKQIFADNGPSWNTYCARGEVRHGPSRSFDSTARRELRMEYRDGKLHGWFIELVMNPTMTVQGNHSSYGNTSIPHAERVATGAEALNKWIPLATPPILSCPPFTTQHNKQHGKGWVAECRLADGTAHGPRRAALWRPGSERWSFFDNGVKQKQVLHVSDGRTSQEMLYENGVMKRRLQFAASKIQIFEARDGNKRAMIRWHPKGGVAQLSRFVAGKRDGQWLRWHESGKLAERTLYRNGAEQPGAQTFDKKGRVKETRRLTAGNGTVESRDSSNRVSICTYRDNRKHGSCRTTNAKGVLIDERHYNQGTPTGRKSWYDSGTLRTDWINRAETGYSKQTNYDASGRVTQVSECKGGECSTVKYDRQGKATRVPAAQPADALRHIEDLL